jgi:ribonuclease BN (tRNA processing enzyme)
MAQDARPNKLLLTHFYPEWDEIDDIVCEARTLWAGEVVEATDGLTLEI